ncbi:MAG: hypothetical protein AAB113_12875, partial [Candidatus Eisenbacteria bacterium]
QQHVAAIERVMGRTVPRGMLPDFDYQMRPTEISQVVSYPEAAARPAGAAPMRGSHAAARPASTARHARTARKPRPATHHKRRK